MPNSIISRVYLDMDGVIADFDKSYKKLNSNFDEFIATRQFENLDMMPGAMDLINFLRKSSVPTSILSSTANEENHDEISKQKLIWLQKHGITFNPIFVPGKNHKYKFAKPDTLIIDDTQSVIDDWRKAGGHAIWHRDVVSTLAILKMYL